MGRSLASRIALLVVAVVAATVVVAGVLATELVRQTSTTSARQQLVRLADRPRPGPTAATSVRRCCASSGCCARSNVQLAVLNAHGRVVGNPAVQAVAHGRTTSPSCGRASRSPSSARSTGTPSSSRPGPPRTAASCCVQRRSEALAAGERSVRRMLLALLVGVAIAIPASVVLARALARPLRRTAQAAHALADGSARRAGARRGTRRGRRRRRLGQRDRGGAAALRGTAADVPDVGVARPAHAADGDPWLRRVDARRCPRRGHARGRRGADRGVAAPRAARRGPARPRAAAGRPVPGRRGRGRAGRPRRRDRPGVGGAVPAGAGVVLRSWTSRRASGS